MYHIFSEEELKRETQYAKANGSMSHSSQILNESLCSLHYNASWWEAGQEVLRTTATVRDERLSFCGQFKATDVKWPIINLISKYYYVRIIIILHKNIHVCFCMVPNSKAHNSHQIFHLISQWHSFI